MTLQFEYKKTDEEIDVDNFFTEEGNLVFDKESSEQMKVMMQEICDKLLISDAYLIKKLEVVLKYDLPFFATTRNLAKKWTLENFIF